LNLIDNAIYWLGQLKKGERTLEIRTARTRRGDRIKVSVHDSGPGISAENSERVFWPGVTTKPGGIGMGLTVASEIVDAYDGKMALVQPASLAAPPLNSTSPSRSNSHP
jgi:C4-dicarboxylate-specific signal transduction histidine kinase